MVESECGAAVVGRIYLLPPLSSGGASLVRPWPVLASLVAGADDDARTAFLAEVNARLQSYVDHQGLAFPIESNVAVARE